MVGVSTVLPDLIPHPALRTVQVLMEEAERSAENIGIKSMRVGT
jgi:hypothetical protein